MKIINFKKILLILAVFLMTFLNFNLGASAEDIFKINSANFDTSNAFVVLTSQDNSTTPILKQVKTVKLENPRRVYFDIDSAILTFPKRDWTFNSGAIKQLRISQFSNNPAKVRVVMYLQDNYNPSNINIVKVKNNIFIKFKNPQLQNDYFQNTYRDDHTSASDFYEYTTVMSSEPTDNNDIAGQIQNAFNQSNATKQDLKLNSKYYLNTISVKGGGLLLNGFGSTTIERPLILTNPSRIVFDIPNTVVNPALRNRELKINQTDSAKISQFSVNKARITITANDVTNYIPIFSNDGQSIIIANDSKINKNSLFSETSDAIAYNVDKENSLTSSLILSFSKPVVNGIDRNSKNFDIYLYNVMKYNESAFKDTIEGTAFSKAKIDLLPQVGLKLSMPIEQSAILSTYMSIDGKNLKLTVKNAKPIVAESNKHYFPPINSKPVVTNPSKYTSGTKRVVLDAGHGGKDVGAVGGGKWYEKDVNLDVTKRVHDILVKRGYSVVLTRPNDTFVSLQDRVAISESSNPDIFVSIHVNSSTSSSATGLETHYYHQESIPLAQSVHSSLASAINSPNRGLLKSKFYVINHTTVPAILVEIGFISNPTEREELFTSKRRQATAQAIADGIQNYFH
ncbi:MAG: N-acetylmuramoyl-L-alanine amidase [Clostridiaceae bacterium]|jgi:N-acetylmuramoyl-L-alanine amidase|nr:N-acetylmuramoyl-L-alanine amidase [Clostridiaceae bacterium]